MNKFPNTITTLIEITLNRYLDLDPDAKSNMSALADKIIQITIRDLDVPLYMKVSGDRIEVLSSFDEAVDSEIRASVISLMKMGLARDAKVVGEDIEMSGDLETGRQFRDLLAKVDIDWEEILSGYTGDIMAHKIGNSVRILRNWGKKTVEALRKDISEYLQEEGRQLPSPYEVTQFIKQVDDVRLAVDRAEARINHLENRWRQSHSDTHEALD
ncbi:ubiquinone biosynthesis accessory factor UbiJ [Kaarinaea lacus]